MVTCQDLQELVHQAIRVEQQLKRCQNHNQTYTSSTQRGSIQREVDGRFDVDQIMTKDSKSEVHASTNVKPLEQPKKDMGKTIILVGKLPVPILGQMSHQISSCNLPPKPN